MSTVTTLSQIKSSSASQHFLPGEGRKLAESEASPLCSVCPPLSRPNTEITSIDIQESLAFPEPRNDPQPAHWNNQLRGNPPYRALNRNQDFSTRPL